MSLIIGNKPVAMWTNEELKDYLDELVCTRGTPDDIAVIAESVARLLAPIEEGTK